MGELGSISIVPSSSINLIFINTRKLEMNLLMLFPWMLLPISRSRWEVGRSWQRFFRISWRYLLFLLWFSVLLCINFLYHYFWIPDLSLIFLLTKTIFHHNDKAAKGKYNSYEYGCYLCVCQIYRNFGTFFWKNFFLIAFLISMNRFTSLYKILILLECDI